MAIDQYRKQTDSILEAEKQAILARVMESRQVELSHEDDKIYHLAGGGSRVQSERLPDWFAD